MQQYLFKNILFSTIGNALQTELCVIIITMITLLITNKKYDKACNNLFRIYIYTKSTLKIWYTHLHLNNGYGLVWYGNCLFDKIKSTLKHNSKYIISES